MKKEVLERYEEILPHVNQSLEKKLNRINRHQQFLAKSVSNKKFFKLPNVVGTGVGLQMKGKTPTGRIGPIICVSRKVPISKLKRNERIPKTISIKGKRYKTDVVELRNPQPLMGLGVPDTQRKPHDPIPPDVQFGAHDPSDGLFMHSFTGGAIVRRIDDTSPNPTLFLLTAKHALEKVITYIISQPAGGRIVGGHVASSSTLDAALSEIHKPSIPFHCFGLVSNTIQAILGMNVKKSGGRTGITGSQVIGVANIPWNGNLCAMVIIDDQFGVVPYAPYHDAGDSGSMSLLGSPTNPFDFGDPINAIVQIIIHQFSSYHDRMIVWLILNSLLVNAAVGLNVGEANFGRFTLAHPIDEVLSDLKISLI